MKLWTNEVACYRIEPITGAKTGVYFVNVITPVSSMKIKSMFKENRYQVMLLISIAVQFNICKYNIHVFNLISCSKIEHIDLYLLEL